MAQAPGPLIMPLPKLPMTIPLVDMYMVRLRLILTVCPAQVMNVVMLELRKPLFLLRFMISGELRWVLIMTLGRW